MLLIAFDELYTVTSKLEPFNQNIQDLGTAPAVADGNLHAAPSLQASRAAVHGL